MYYLVMPASNQYKASQPLTYTHHSGLSVGNIVKISLKNAPCFGVVCGSTNKPKFATKSISNTTAYTLSKPSIELANRIANYYQLEVATILSGMIPATLGAKSKEAVESTIQDIQKAPKLWLQQKQALQIFSRTDTSSMLLHGATASGKTRVYTEMIKLTTSAGKNVLFLIPEISLVPQLSQALQQYTSAPIVALHSQMTSSEKRKAWLRIAHSHKPLIILGPRSALFMPFSNLGLIIVDEAHESSYWQEQAPRYHALRVAGMMRQIHSCKLVFGTATPLISEYYALEKLNIPVVTMLAPKLAERVCHIINVKDKSLFSSSQIISQPLIEAIKQAKKNNTTSLLYLNRRGSARIIQCTDCNWQAVCPDCTLQMVYHKDLHIMRCHTCGKTSIPPTTCPDCKKSNLTYQVPGTKAVIEEAKKVFPGFNIVRFDGDNTKKDRFENNQQDVLSGKYDIIVGTQLLAKGHDLPNLAVVGILQADSGMAIPDYTSAEKSYQLLHQVIGRVGRGHTTGEVFIQTIRPDNPIIIDATNQDWMSFYNREIKTRETYKFPPFAYLAKVTAIRKTSASAEKALQKLIKSLPHKGLNISPPAPALLEKQGGSYNWQIVIKAKDRTLLNKLSGAIPSNFHYEIDPSSII